MQKKRVLKLGKLRAGVTVRKINTKSGDFYGKRPKKGVSRSYCIYQQQKTIVNVTVFLLLVYPCIKRF